MIIKKYVVDKMQQAVQQIKEELGPEAIIVSTQKIHGPGIVGFLKKRLEVTAVLDKSQQSTPVLPQIQAPPELINPTRTVVEQSAKDEQINPIITEASNLARTINAGQASKNINRQANIERSCLLATNKSHSSVGFKPLLEEAVMKSLEQQEKERLLAMLEQQLAKMNKAGDQNFNRHWLRVLIDADVDQGIAKQLVEDLEQMTGKYDAKVKDDMLKVALVNRITKLLEPAYADVVTGQAGADVSKAECLAFIGPPGVGKTTTLAKLATRFKLLEGKKVALITVYTYRYGTADQLKIYGNTIDVPVDVVMTPAELRQAVERHADKDYVLIDTVGRSSKNTGQVLELKGFLESINGLKQIYLVMSATTKDRDLFRIIKDFQIAKYTGCIFTKTDETETLGSMLNIVLKTGVPLRYCTDGQVIPDDIIEVQPRNLAQLIFRSVK